MALVQISLEHKLAELQDRLDVLSVSGIMLDGINDIVRTWHVLPCNRNAFKHLEISDPSGIILTGQSFCNLMLVLHLCYNVLLTFVWLFRPPASVPRAPGRVNLSILVEQIAPLRHSQQQWAGMTVWRHHLDSNRPSLLRRWYR